MRKIKTINKKGTTDVKSKPHGSPSGKKLFDARKAEAIRDESRWDAFQLVGESNREEMEHESRLVRKKSDAEMQKILDRALAFRMGQKIKMVLDTEAA